MFAFIIIACSNPEVITYNFEGETEIVETGMETQLLVWLKGLPDKEYYVLVELDRPGGKSYFTRTCRTEQDPTPNEELFIKGVGLEVPETWTKVTCALGMKEDSFRPSRVWVYKDEV